MSIAFVFPGQGAQYIGMAKEICSQYPKSAEIFKLASEALKIDMEEMVFNGDEETLKITENTQPAILTASIACLQPILDAGIEAAYTAGLSLGEYAAHVYSGTFTFSEAVKLVKKRGRFMQDAVPAGVGSMAAIVGLGREDLLQVCEQAKEFGVAEPANFNCPGQIVISGEVLAIEKASAMALEKGAKRVIPLAVSAPFHSSLLISAGDMLEVEMENVDIQNMKVPVVTNISGEIVQEGHARQTLVQQVSNSVLWEDCVQTMIALGVDTFIEIGPGKVLSGFIKKINKDVTTLNVEDMASLEATLKFLKG
ncbi:MAG: ACP S-malonyltransferase [Thermoclostridium sp.]|nr:ACP S-malonyltransferase [Thermoclostridium sp.]